ncbi:MAG TPA: NYN domain-containing protein [Candidatus Dormibacteraeota bacterium]|nr:NYN domain-containing protein [Candidatus Dormibacteraeota bacterium]
MSRDRFAVFVDAGYLLAAGAELVAGSKARSDVTVKYQAFMVELTQKLRNHCHLEFDLLRIYWYDGAQPGLPSGDHLTIGELPSVKLRLGRLVNKAQKGVDTLIVLDLTSLARERAMCTAYLISGDEDIREGVVAAQQLGVRVVLVGVPTSGGAPNQARTLIREADEHLVLDRATEIDPFFNAVRPAPTPIKSTTKKGKTPREVGNALGLAWLAKAAPAEITVLKSQSPKIPPEVDAQLVRDAEASLGALQGRIADRKELRGGFWDAVMAG